MGVRGYTDLLSNLYTLEQLVKQIHAFHFLLKVCTSVNIQRERNIFVSENFRKRFDVKLWHLNSSDSKCMANFVKLHFFQFISFQKACKELTVGTRFCRSGFAGQEVVIWVICIELFDDVHEQGRNRNGSRRSFCFRPANKSQALN